MLALAFRYVANFSLSPLFGEFEGFLCPSLAATPLGLIFLDFSETY
jgi:hypothetical protein